MPTVLFKIIKSMFLRKFLQWNTIPDLKSGFLWIGSSDLAQMNFF